jgi:phosphoribosylformylglycinamidine synthase
MIGIISDYKKRCTQYFKNDGDLVILLGETKEEVGGSEYLKVMHDKVAGDAPELDLEKEKAVQKVVYDAIQKGLVSSAHDCSEGGLAVALAECCMNDKLGVIVDKLPEIRTDALLFGESQSRIILSADKKSAGKIEELAKKNNVQFAAIGYVDGERFKIDKLIDLPLKRIQEAWSKGLTKHV